MSNLDDPKRSHTLFVEMSEKLWGQLNERVASEQKKHPNRRVTKAEIVRDILTKELRR